MSNPSFQGSQVASSRNSLNSFAEIRRFFCHWASSRSRVSFSCLKYGLPNGMISALGFQLTVRNFLNISFVIVVTLIGFLCWPQVLWKQQIEEIKSCRSTTVKGTLAPSVVLRHVRVSMIPRDSSGMCDQSVMPMPRRALTMGLPSNPVSSSGTLHPLTSNALNLIVSSVMVEPMIQSKCLALAVA